MDGANYELALAIQNALVPDARSCMPPYGIETVNWNIGAMRNKDTRLSALDDAADDGVRRSVDSRGLMSLFEEFKIDEVDFLKMDIEGAEAAVLSGPLEWLKRVPVFSKSNCILQ